MKVKTHKSRIILRILLAVLIALAGGALLLYCPTGTPAKRDYSDDADEGVWESVSAADWMAKVDGALTLSEISMPGTHDSATEYVTLPLIGRCQDSSIAQQLDMGVRVLDIRLNTHDNGDGTVSLTLSNSILDCKASASLTADALSFDAVVADCRAFLAAHPTETILMLVKHEHGDADARQVEDALLASFGDGGGLYTENRDPALDEVRGKIVLARRYGAGEEGLSGLNFCWADQGGSGVAGIPCVTQTVSDNLALCVQDHYAYGTQDKWNAVAYCIDRSQAEKGTLLLNYLSTKGTGACGMPLKYAQVMNGWFIQHELLSGKDYGCVMFDYVSEGLARHVFAANSYQE